MESKHSVDARKGLDNLMVVHKAVKLFFKELMRLGLYDQYISARLRQSETLFRYDHEKCLDDIICHLADHLIKWGIVRTPTEGCKYLKSDFRLSKVSFIWSLSKEGYKYWETIWFEKIRR